MVTPDASTRRRFGVVAASSLAIAAIVLGVAAVKLGGDTPEASPGDTAKLSAGVDEPRLDLDLGPITGTPEAEGCTGPVVHDAAPAEVLYGVRQRSASDSSPVLLLREESGDLLMCDVAGPDRPAQVPVPEATPNEPVTFLTNGRSHWECTGEALDRYTSSTWLSVASIVERVEQRFVVDGTPGPWFSTRALGGYAHLQTWLDGPVEAGTALSTEYRVLDERGQPVAQSSLPSSTELPGGCADGGDVTIG